MPNTKDVQELLKQIASNQADNQITQGNFTIKANKVLNQKLKLIAEDLEAKDMNAETILQVILMLDELAEQGKITNENYKEFLNSK